MQVNVHVTLFTDLIDALRDIIRIQRLPMMWWLQLLIYTPLAT